MLDYILNGQIHGEAADRLAMSDWDVGHLRPFLWKGRSWVTVTNGYDDNGEPKLETIPAGINNAATLTDLQWQLIDDKITPVARQRLQLVSMMEAAGMVYNVPGGPGNMVLLTQSISDTNDAQMNMDAVVDAENDRSLLDLSGIPLPITNKEFFFTARELWASRNRGRAQTSAPLDLTNAANAARKIGEFTEKLFIGTGGTYTYGGYTLYGLINYPYRFTKTITAPTASGWSPAVTLQEVLEMVTTLQDNGFFGPYSVLYGRNWMKYFENDYSTQKGDNTVLDRLRRVSGISSFQQLDYLNRANFDLIVMQMTEDVVRVVNAMPLTTVQWDTHGGMRKYYKLMKIQVPQFRRTYAGTTGYIHGASA